MIRLCSSYRVSRTLSPYSLLHPFKVFPHGTGFVLVFDYMLSDLSEVVRDAERPLTEAQIKSYVLMLLKGVAYCHEIGES